jgi:phosphoribosylaminoimidazole carboxylase (NCAIR synthetase)
MAAKVFPSEVREEAKPPVLTAAEVPALVARAQEGDVAAFERLIASHQQKVFSFALAFTSNRDEARDLAQESLIKVYRSIGSLVNVAALLFVSVLLPQLSVSWALLANCQALTAPHAVF